MGKNSSSSDESASSDEKPVKKQSDKKPVKPKQKPSAPKKAASSSDDGSSSNNELTRIGLGETNKKSTASTNNANQRVDLTSYREPQKEEKFKGEERDDNSEEEEIDQGYESDSEAEKDSTEVNELNQPLAKQKLKGLGLYRFKDGSEASKAELSYQKLVNARFFRLAGSNKEKKSGKKSQELYDRIKALHNEYKGKDIQCLLANSSFELNDEGLELSNCLLTRAINLNGYNARAVIIALTSILNEEKCIPTAVFKIGKTNILCISNPTLEQPGNVYLQIIAGEEDVKFFKTKQNKRLPAGQIIFVPSNYKKSTTTSPDRSAEITQRFMYISKDRETHKKIFNKMQERTKDIESTFSYEYVVQNTETMRDGHFINKLNFLRSIIEVARRGYRGAYTSYKAEKLDKLPIGIAQARTALLLSEGKIKVEDAYQSPAFHGAVVDSRLVDNVDVVELKVKKINATYNERYKSHSSYTIEGRNLLRQRLGEEYGGDSESTGNEYSDTDDNLDAERIEYNSPRGKK